MNLSYDTSQAIVGELKTRHFPSFHSLPYNRYEPENSAFWWLSPTGDNLAFRNCKACVIVDDAFIGEGLASCGLNVEKGLKRAWPPSPVKC